MDIGGGGDNDCDGDNVVKMKGKEKEMGKEEEGGELSRAFKEKMEELRCKIEERKMR
jgi:hypothetical protein